jgi:hypothetical protein
MFIVDANGVVTPIGYRYVFPTRPKAERAARKAVEAKEWFEQGADLLAIGREEEANLYFQEARRLAHLSGARTRQA